MRTNSTPVGIHELPVLPTIVAHLLSLDPASPNYFDDLVRLMNVDPALAVRILETANSSVSAPVAPVDTLPTAVARLGSSRIQDLVTSMASTTTFTPSTPSQRRLWTHAVEVATVSQHVGEAFHLGPTFSQHMYLCGLLHDIGRFVMFDDHPEQLGAVEDLGWSTAEQLIAAEHHIWGFDHAELGYHACRHWGVPNDVATMVRSHHTYDGQPYVADEFDTERLAIVQFADMLSLLRSDAADSSESGRDERDVLVERALAHFEVRGFGDLPLKLDALHFLVPTMLRTSTAAATVLGFVD